MAIDFVAQAIQAGAVAIVAQESVERVSLPLVKVADSRKALGLIGSRFYGDPSRGLPVIGVTGTNGKTTTTYICKALLEAIGRQVGLIGTVAYQIGAETIPASHTTPGALELQRLFMNDGASAMDSVVMEVSSHALAMDRTAGCEYDVAVFTNLTQDHLDFHRTMEEYFQAKLRLFTGLGDGKEDRSASYRQYGRSPGAANSQRLSRAGMGLCCEAPSRHKGRKGSPLDERFHV